MSFASVSIRFVSRPAFFNDPGLQVDSARTVTSSPELTRRTGSPFESYQPHATVFGVGISVYDLPTDGDDQSSIAVADPIGALPPGAPTDDGVRQPSASTPPAIRPDTPPALIGSSLRLCFLCRRSVCFAAFAR